MKQAGVKQAKEDQRSPPQVKGVERLPQEDDSQQSRQQGMGAYNGGQVNPIIRSISIPISEHVSNSGSGPIRASIRRNGEEKLWRNPGPMCGWAGMGGGRNARKPGRVPPFPAASIS